MVTFHLGTEDFPTLQLQRAGAARAGPVSPDTSTRRPSTRPPQKRRPPCCQETVPGRGAWAARAASLSRSPASPPPLLTAGRGVGAGGRRWPGAARHWPPTLAPAQLPTSSGRALWREARAGEHGARTGPLPGWCVPGGPTGSSPHSASARSWPLPKTRAHAGLLCVVPTAQQTAARQRPGCLGTWLEWGSRTPSWGVPGQRPPLGHRVLPLVCASPVPSPFLWGPAAPTPFVLTPCSASATPHKAPGDDSVPLAPTDSSPPLPVTPGCPGGKPSPERTNTSRLARPPSPAARHAASLCRGGACVRRGALAAPWPALPPPAPALPSPLQPARPLRAVCCGFLLHEPPASAPRPRAASVPEGLGRPASCPVPSGSPVAGPCPASLRAPLLATPLCCQGPCSGDGPRVPMPGPPPGPQSPLFVGESKSRCPLSDAAPLLSPCTYSCSSCSLPSLPFTEGEPGPPLDLRLLPSQDVLGPASPTGTCAASFLPWSPAWPWAALTRGQLRPSQRAWSRGRFPLVSQSCPRRPRSPCRAVGPGASCARPPQRGGVPRPERGLPQRCALRPAVPCTRGWRLRC